jgi:hypothetical protein
MISRYCKAYCLVIEVEGSVVILKLETDVCCQHNKQTQEPKLIEIDCFVHEFVYF